MLRWSLYQNPVLSNGDVMLALNDFEITRAQFGTTANGGYGDAQITLTVPRAVAWAAIQQNWLMRELRVHDGAGFRAYEGFVAEIDARIGGRNYTRRIDALVNRVRCEYWQPDPLHPGAKRAGVLQINDTDSQALFGIKEQILDLKNQGVMSSTQATQRAEVYLNLSKQGQAFNTEIGADKEDAETELTFSCLGYWATLAWRNTNFRVKTAKNVNTILYTAGNNRSLLTLYLNGYYAQFVNRGNVSNLNNVGVSMTFNTSGGLMTVQDYILAITKYGDGNYRRSYFQLWEDRTPFLTRRVTSASAYAQPDALVTSGRNAVMPYAVRAGDYVLDETYNAPLDDFSSDVKNDPRALFVEQTTYDDMAGTLRIGEPQEDNLTLLLGRAMGRRRFVNG